MSAFRKQFLLGSTAAFSAAAVARFAAGAAEFNYKLGSVVPPTHPVAVRATAAAERIRQQTGGRVDIGVFPNNQLGGDQAMVVQTRAGAIQFLISNDSVMVGMAPLAGMSAIPFAYRNYRDIGAAFDGPLGNFIRKSIVTANLGLYPFDRAWGSGFRQISNTIRPIQTPADIKGLKIRVPNSPVFIETFKALGAVPTPIDGNEIYMALQTHLVDGSDVTLTATETGKYYEVLKYLSLTNHQWQGFTMVANQGIWQQLPGQLRDVIAQNLNAAALQARNDVMHLDDTLRTNLEAQGILFNQVDTASFRASVHAAGLYAKWRDQFGPEAWALLEKTVGTLT